MRYIVTELSPVRSTTSSRVNPDAVRNDRNSTASRRSRTVGVWRLPGTTPPLQLALLQMQSCIICSARAFLTGQSCTRRLMLAAFGLRVAPNLVSTTERQASDRDRPPDNHLSGEGTRHQLGAAHVPRTGRAADRCSLCPVARQAGAVGVAPGRTLRDRRADRVRAGHQCGAGFGGVNRLPPLWTLGARNAARAPV